MGDEREPPPIPRVLRTPEEIPPEEGGGRVWWRPSLAEVRPGLVTWQWVIVGAIVVPLVLLGAAVSFWSWLSVLSWFYEWVLGLGVLAVGFVAVIVERAYAAARKGRTDPYCIHCGYRLVGLPDHHHCPECGRPYSFELNAEYRQNPDWFVERWKRAQKVRGETFSSGRDI